SPLYVDPQGNPFDFKTGMSLAHDDVYLYYGNKCGGVFRTPLAGLPGSAGWTVYARGLPFFFSYYQDPFALFFDGAHLWAGIDDEGAYRTPTSGAPDWVRATQTLIIGGQSQPAIDPTLFRKIGDHVYMGTRNGGLHVVDPSDPNLAWSNISAGMANGADTVR